jgi:multidrug efflux pump subunit AcrA (membrane-fusion protein)
MDTSALIAKLHVGQMQAQALKLGAPATITVPGISDPVSAKVSLISPALDPGSTTVEVWLRVENPNGAYKAGTPVHASVTGRTVASAMTVPAEAIQTATDGNSKFVMVIGSDSAAHKKPITLGIVTKDSAQVLSGIAQQDMVISTGAYGLDEGTKVKIGADPTAKPDDDDKPAGGKDADDK